MSDCVGPLPPNVTENQHFIAQKVQSLNASPSPDGQISHIRAYQKVNEDTIAVTNRVGMPIRRNLAIKDLYSFDVTGQMRRNFEALFHRYESNVPQLTVSLLAKIRAARSDLQQEILGILSAKFLDVARNPYSIRKCLNTFPTLSKHHPTDPDSYATYRRIWEGHNPRQAKICKMLGVTDDEYRRWLVTLFMLLYQHVGMQETFLDQLISGLINSRDDYAATYVFIYDKPVVLLSDRSVNEVANTQHLAWEFHASAEMFITFASLKMEALDISKERLAQSQALRTPQLDVQVFRNHYAMLEQYNQRSVHQSFQHVYGVASSFPGVTIADG